MTSATRHLLGAAVLLATGALAAACGPVKGNSASGGASSPPSGGAAAASSAPASPASSPAASHGGTAAAGCSSSGLSAHVDLAQGGAAAGSVYVPIDFTNTTGGACTMEGYPGVSFVRGPSGGQLGNAATRNPAAPPAMVTLAPGGVAHAILQVAEAGNFSQSACTPVAAHWLKIFPPNQVAAIYVHYEAQACSARLPAKLGSQLAVYVVRPGAGKAGHAP
jgi:Protein of unknown function (DUF4232)